MTTVNLGGILVGDGHPCYVLAELGINHGGSVVTAEKMIDAAAYAGAQGVKIQKRGANYYSAEELARPLESPYGTTRGDYVRARELGRQAVIDLARYAQAKGLQFTASCWDLESLDDVMSWCEPPFLKVASAVLTWPASIRDPLLRAHAQANRPIVMSTGMSDLTQIDEAIAVLENEWQTGHTLWKYGPGIVLLGCTSTYPCEDAEINLRTMHTLRERYGVPVGWSHHDRSIATSVAAVAMGSCMIERHLTLDRTLFGSDQSSSIEPGGFARMVRDVRVAERAMGSAEKRVLASEIPVRAKLARVAK